MFVPTVLTTVLEHLDRQYIILSDTWNIIQFFQLHKLSNVTLYEYHGGNVCIISKEKKRLKSFWANYSIDSITFYHAEFGELANWLLLKESQRGVLIYYCKLYDSIPCPHAKWYQGLKIKLKQWLSFNYWPDVLRRDDNYMPSLPNSFYKRLKVQVVPNIVNTGLLSQYIRTIIGSLGINGKVLLVSGSVLECNEVEEDEYTKKINSLIDMIGVDNASVKCHPRFNDLLGKELNLPEVPKYIPGNLLIDVFDVFIGYSSTLLVEAAQQGKLVISNIYLMKPQHKDAPNCLYKYLENRLGGKGVIHYPKTIEEVKQILTERKRNN